MTWSNPLICEHGPDGPPLLTTRQTTPARRHLPTMPTKTCEPVEPLSDKTDKVAQSDDRALLAEYLDGSETAFAALVRRHTDLVYSSALRQVRDPHTAADVTSAVFMVLARKAGELTAGVVIAAWLHSTTRYA